MPGHVGSACPNLILLNLARCRARPERVLSYFFKKNMARPKTSPDRASCWVGPATIFSYVLMIFKLLILEAIKCNQNYYRSCLCLSVLYFYVRNNLLFVIADMVKIYYEQMDKVINEVFKMVDADDGKFVKEDEFKKLLLEIIGSIMLQLEGNPVSVSTNSVVHEPLADPSSFLQTSAS